MGNKTLSNCCGETSNFITEDAPQARTVPSGRRNEPNRSSKFEQKSGTRRERPPPSPRPKFVSNKGAARREDMVGDKKNYIDFQDNSSKKYQSFVVDKLYATAMHAFLIFGDGCRLILAIKLYLVGFKAP